MYDKLEVGIIIVQENKGLFLLCNLNILERSKVSEILENNNRGLSKKLGYLNKVVWFLYNIRKERIVSFILNIRKVKQLFL